MNYFTAGIYGDLNAYKKIKSILGPEDRLWILGDVLDGNDEHPEECLRILDDIKESENVTLILGDHEYFHAMRLFSEMDDDDEEEASVWENELSKFEYSGDALVQYMKTVLSRKEREEYANYLSSLDVSDIAVVDGRLFYLCHGAPARMEDKESQWQYSVVTSNVDLFKTYSRDMASDIRIPYFAKTYGIRRSQLESAILMVGHTFVATLEMEGEDTEDGIVFSNRIMCINNGASANNGGTHIVVGIDSAGWQTFEIGGK